MAALATGAAAGDNRGISPALPSERLMRAARSRLWLRVGLATTAAGLMTGLVLSAVAKVEDASDRTH